MIPNYITELKNFVQRMLILFADGSKKERAGRKIKLKYCVKLLNKDVNANDQSKAKPRAVLENLKGEKTLDIDRKGHGSMCMSG